MKHLLLAGGGHAHALLLRDWRALAGWRVTLLSPAPLAPYSGRVPGWLAGRFAWEDICVDLPALCRRAGATFTAGSIAALDPDARTVRLEDGRVLRADLLSLNLGSTVELPVMATGAAAGDADHGSSTDRRGTARSRLLPLRPAAALRDAWPRWLSDAPSTVSVLTLGGGAAGVESTLAVVARLRAQGRTVHATLRHAGERLLPGFPAATARAATRALDRAGIGIELRPTDVSSSGDRQDAPGVDPASDLVLVATGARPHPWQRDPRARGTLAVDAAGFVRIDATLRSVSHPWIFAAGDCAAWPHALPKSGVHAVRMAPTLLHNLRAAMMDAPLRDHRPPPRTLALLDTADGRALGARGSWSVQGRWVARWKHMLDDAFLRGLR